MTEISAEDGIERARSQLGLGPLTSARAWRVRRIDGHDRVYYLIVFGDPESAVGVAAVDAADSDVMAAAVSQTAGPHLTVDADQALRKAKIAGAQAELVWRPCRASLSPLYPLWQVSSRTETVFVDQEGVVWKVLESAGPGG
jgi:hypothetical protein